MMRYLAILAMLVVLLGAKAVHADATATRLAPSNLELLSEVFKISVSRHGGTNKVLVIIQDRAGKPFAEIKADLIIGDNKTTQLHASLAEFRHPSHEGNHIQFYLSDHLMKNAKVHLELPGRITGSGGFVFYVSDFVKSNKP